MLHCNSSTVMTLTKRTGFKGPSLPSELQHSPSRQWQALLLAPWQYLPGLWGTNSEQETTTYARGAAHPGPSSNHNWHPSCTVTLQLCPPHGMPQGKALSKGGCYYSCQDHSAHTPGGSKRLQKKLVSKTDTTGGQSVRCACMKVTNPLASKWQRCFFFFPFWITGPG